MQTIEPIARAVEAFASLPGIGPKTAQRLTFHLLRQPAEAVRELAEAILNTYAILAVNESYSDADLDDTVKAFERVVAWFQSKR